MLKYIFHSHVKIRHLLAVNVLSILSVFLMLKCVDYLMGFITLFLAGDGNLPPIWQICLYTLCFIGVVIFLYSILYFKMRTHFEQERFAKAKSYLIAGIVALFSIGYFSIA